MARSLLILSALAALLVPCRLADAFPGGKTVTLSNATSNSGAKSLALPKPGKGGGASLLDPPGRDAVIDWNGILLNVNAIDHSGIYGSPEQGGPCRTARAFAIVHIAIFDAVNCIKPRAKKYLTYIPAPGASIDAAVAQAAHDTLVVLYPAQAQNIDVALSTYLNTIHHSPAKHIGIKIGAHCARRILEARADDGSDFDPGYTPGDLPGDHRPDPKNPNQGFLNPGWGVVTPFCLLSSDQFRAPAPPALDSPEYATAYNEVKDYGGDGFNTPTIRDADQTEIGIYWGYDGAIGLGTPPRLYNQIARLISQQQGTSEVDNARLFALINICQAEAGLCCWESKYVYNFWRPILGIREADPGTGPSGLGDGNPDTTGDTMWCPLGAPASNGSNGGNGNFTPSFPAYPSGHATFGASLFRLLALYYGTDNIPFTFVSDELNGETRDADGVTVRPFSPRSFSSFSEADAENAQSRIYLGVHWQFNATAGMDAGHEVAEWVFENCLQPHGGRLPFPFPRH